jgi:hypothetical protein
VGGRSAAENSQASLEMGTRAIGPCTDADIPAAAPPMFADMMAPRFADRHPPRSTRTTRKHDEIERLQIERRPICGLLPRDEHEFAAPL